MKKKVKKAQESGKNDTAVMSEKQLKDSCALLTDIATHKKAGFIILMELDENRDGDSIQLKMNGCVSAHGTSKYSVIKGIESAINQMEIEPIDLVMASLKL